MKKLLVLAASLTLASVAAFAQDLAFQTDHFKCYFPAQVTDVLPTPIFLQDQFSANPATVGKIYRLCNPTKKAHAGVITPIQFPDDHLVIQTAGPQPLVTRQVKIRNQFGDQVLTTLDARFIAGPTQKDPHAPPQSVDHFSCYAVANGPVLNVPVGLSDQFFPAQHKVGRPVLFCNPVQKTHDGVVTPIVHPNDHLTCYNMTRVAFDKTVDLHNQFGDHRFQTAYADSVCVPTQKLGWKVVD